MNCKEVDNIWRTFASKNNLEIEVSNDNYFYGIKTKYFIVLNTESPKIVLEGLLNKNNQG
jgi:fibrillarin-like rRNA methylase